MVNIGYKLACENSRLSSLHAARNVFPVPADLLDNQSNLSAAYLGTVNHKAKVTSFRCSPSTLLIGE